MAAENQQKRQVAYKVRIKDILNNEFVKGEGWDPSYLQTPSGMKISRMNLIAIVIDKAPQGNDAGTRMVLDDGFNQISCRSFDKSESLNTINIGDIVLIIGRPRSFNNDIYILPEIMKRIDSRWLVFRKNELERDFDYATPKEAKKQVQDIPETKEEDVEISIDVNPKEMTIEKKDEEVIFTPAKIIELIRKLDQGGGVDYDSVIQHAKLKDSENIINLLLREGEIFEISPGKLKVLE